MPSGITKELLPCIIFNATTKLKWQIKTLQNICQHFAIIQCLIGTFIFHSLCLHTKHPFYNPLDIKHFPFFLKFGLKPWVSTMPTPDLCKQIMVTQLHNLTQNLLIDCEVVWCINKVASDITLELFIKVVQNHHYFPTNLCVWTNTVLAKIIKLAPKSLGPITFYHSTVMPK